MRGKKQSHPDSRKQGDLQDGMLAYYLEQAAHADSNIERRIDLEPFDFRDMMRGAKKPKVHK